ncbi:hypothetical protein WKW79_14995 [Variovorax robiniae]|uniref:Uncharacterized protein n=1 Tax=Variovorax robiniae TaxID=1836199 RepID=A0ABU8X7S1_9BURK
MWQATLRLRFIHMTAPTLTTHTATIKTFRAIPISTPHAVSSAEAAVPPSSGSSNGIEQHATQAPARPKAANKGFVIVNLQGAVHSASMNLKAQAT